MLIPKLTCFVGSLRGGTRKDKWPI